MPNARTYLREQLLGSPAAVQSYTTAVQQLGLSIEDRTEQNRTPPRSSPEGVCNFLEGRACQGAELPHATRHEPEPAPTPPVSTHAERGKRESQRDAHITAQLHLASDHVDWAIGAARLGIRHTARAGCWLAVKKTNRPAAAAQKVTPHCSGAA